MKLFLLSSGLGAVSGFIKAGSVIGFVPTAGEVYENPYFVNDDRERLKRLGYVVEDMDISGAGKKTLIGQAHRVDAFFVAGGNTFYLMQQIRKSAIEDEWKNLILAGKPYIGASAGAVIAGPTIEPVQTLDDLSKAPELHGFAGMSLTDFVVFPHFGKEKYRAKYESIISTYKNRFDVVPLHDDQAILVIDRQQYEIIDSAIIE